MKTARTSAEPPTTTKSPKPRNATNIKYPPERQKQAPYTITFRTEVGRATEAQLGKETAPRRQTARRFRLWDYRVSTFVEFSDALQKD